MSKETNMEKFVYYLNNEISDFVYKTISSIEDGQDFIVEHDDGKFVVSYERNVSFPKRSFFLVYNLDKEGFMFGRSDISDDKLKEFLVEIKIKNIIKK